MSVSSLSLGDLGLECLLSEDFDSGDSDSRRFGRRRLANCGYIGLGYGYGYGPLIIGGGEKNLGLTIGGGGGG